ncbi:protein of unknown function (DUF1083) [Opitutaceae bacterium TAV1]|nr:protein of unknown function (DUF1083) [Opitutaceae bacterium TAV1]
MNFRGKHVRILTRALGTLAMAGALHPCAIAASTDMPSPPPAVVTATLRTSEFDNVFFPDESKSLRLSLQNKGMEARLFSIDTESIDERGARNASTRTATLAPGASTEVAALLELPEPCFADVTISVSSEGLEPLVLRTSVAVVRRPALGRIPFKEAFYGFSFFANPEVAQRIGGRFIRPMIHWKFSQPERDRFNIGEFVDLGQRGHAVGVDMIYTFAVHQRPGWLGENDSADLAKPEMVAEFSRWVKNVLERLPVIPAGVEISNEPDLEFGRSKQLDYKESARVAAGLLRAGYDVAKARSPEIAVLGAGVSGVDFHNELTFARTMLEAAPGRVDYFSPHPYADARYIDGKRFVEWPDGYALREYLEKSAELLKCTNGRAVWSTELGWGVPADETFLSPVTRDFAAVCGQVLVLFKTVPHVEKYAFFAGQLSNWFERGFSYAIFAKEASGRRPLPPVSAYATVTSLLEGSGTGTWLDLGPAVQAWFFENKATGRAVAALWATGHDVRFVPPASSAAATVARVDLFGREAPLLNGALPDGAPLELSRSPVFLSTELARGGDLQALLRAGRWRAERAVQISHVGCQNADALEIEVTSFLQDDTPAEVSVNENTSRVTLKPGTNRVRVPMPDATDWLREGTLELPVAVVVEGNRIETVAHKEIVNAPWRAPTAFSVDGILDAREARLLSGNVDGQAFIRPPDPAAGWAGTEDLSLRYGYAWNEHGLYLLVVARDDVMSAASASEAGSFWNFDSLQAAFASATDSRSGFRPWDREVGLFAMKDASVTGFVQTHPLKSGQLTHSAKVGRQGRDTVYELFLPWSYFRGYGSEPAKAGDVLAVNFIVNDNDGAGRRFWMGPADGIGSGKHPEAYPWLYLAVPAVSTTTTPDGGNKTP